MLLWHMVCAMFDMQRIIYFFLSIKSNRLTKKKSKEALEEYTRGIQKGNP